MDFKLTNEDRKFFRVGFSNTLIIVLICFYFFMWAINRHYDLAYPIVTFLIFFVTLFFYFYYSTCISSILSSGEKIVIKKAFSETSINISDIKNISIYHLPATAIWIFFKTKQRRFGESQVRFS